MFDFPELGIRLRGFQGEKDLDQIVAIHNDREIAALVSVGFVVPPAPNKLKEEYQKVIENSTEIFCIIESLPDPKSASTAKEVEWIGFVGLYANPDERKRRESAYTISLWRRFWDKGYGTAVTKFIIAYAFDSLFMHRIKLSVFEGNDRAVAVYKNCGFVLEGRQRKALRTSEGGWKDIINMGMIIDDWTELKDKGRRLNIES